MKNIVYKKQSSTNEQKAFQSKSVEHLTFSILLCLTPDDFTCECGKSGI